MKTFWKQQCVQDMTKILVASDLERHTRAKSVTRGTFGAHDFNVETVSPKIIHCIFSSAYPARIVVGVVLFTP